VQTVAFHPRKSFIKIDDIKIDQYAPEPVRCQANEQSDVQTDKQTDKKHRSGETWAGPVRAIIKVSDDG